MTTTGAAIHGFTVQDVVVAFLDFLGCEERLPVIMSIPSPLYNGVEHHTLNLNAVVAVSGMVEDPKDVINHLVDGHTGVLPSIDNSAVVGISTGRIHGGKVDTYGTTY